MTSTFAADGFTRLFHCPASTTPPLVLAQDFNALHKRHLDLLRIIEGNSGFDTFWTSLWAGLGVVVGHEERERARTVYSASIAREIEPYRSLVREALGLTQAMARASLCAALPEVYQASISTALDSSDPESQAAATKTLAAHLRQMAADIEPGITPDSDTWGAGESLLGRRLPANPPTPVTWPSSRDIARSGDMAPRERTHLRLLLDADNDLIVEVWEQGANDVYGQRASIEFCNGGGGGGASSHTRAALLGVMVAMERDNAADPSRRWPILNAPPYSANESKASSVEGLQQ
jgi:hypothetical protein